MSVASVKTAFVIMLSVFIIALSKTAMASPTDGTIDPASRYAWSENTGWIDLGSVSGNVHVTASELTGYAWSENTGWISLNCSNTLSCGTVAFKAVNDGLGNLSGYAWGENTGWIDLSPVGGGVSINADGEFLGYAWGENTGWIVFNCATTGTCAAVDYKVKTDWRASVPPPPTPSGGGGISPKNAGLIGLESFSIAINNSELTTDFPQVTLRLAGGPNTAMVKVSENPQFDSEKQIPYDPSLAKNNANFLHSETPGAKTVYAKFCTAWDLCSSAFSASITLSAPPLPPAPSERSVFDTDADGRVDMNEFNQMMVNWGPQGIGTPYDFDGNGEVDIFDFNQLMANWTI